jgi:hypothetical protein
MKKVLLAGVAMLSLLNAEAAYAQWAPDFSKAGQLHYGPSAQVQDKPVPEWFQNMWNRMGQFQLGCTSTQGGKNTVFLDVQWKEAKIIRTDWKGYGNPTTTTIPITKVVMGSNFADLM